MQADDWGAAVGIENRAGGLTVNSLSGRHPEELWPPPCVALQAGLAAMAHYEPGRLVIPLDLFGFPEDHEDLI